MLSTVQQRGFTLIELLFGIALLAILVGLGVPTLSTLLQNSKIASVASGYYAGLQAARSEAIRRNVRTEFVLTDDPVSTPDLANVLVPAVAGRNWVIRAASGPAAFAPAVEAKAGVEGEGSAAVPSIVVTGSAGAPAVFDGRIPFSGFGGTADGAAYQIDITRPLSGTCVNVGGNVRCRRINISPGGQVTSCDPAAPVGDSRAC